MIIKRSHEVEDDGVSYDLQSTDGTYSPYGNAVTEEWFHFCTAGEAGRLLREMGYWTEWFGFTPRLIPGRMYCIHTEKDIRDYAYVCIYGGKNAWELFRTMKKKEVIRALLEEF